MASGKFHGVIAATTPTGCLGHSEDEIPDD
jgi:hypothetical protein